METKSAASHNPFIKFTISILPNRLKRLTFLASIAAIAKDTKVTDTELIHKLNNLLELSATGDDALKLPIHVSKLIWSNKILFQSDLDTLVHSTEGSSGVTECAQRLLDYTPEWFWYSDKQTIIKDILAMFTSRNNIFLTHSTGLA